MTTLSNYILSSTFYFYIDNSDHLSYKKINNLIYKEHCLKLFWNCSFRNSKIISNNSYLKPFQYIQPAPKKLTFWKSQHGTIYDMFETLIRNRPHRLQFPITTITRVVLPLYFNWLLCGCCCC